ncbi:L-threonylcarbamoyladenylate synthase [Alkalispirochaeta americana]|uniref:Threonylcarbamoyl-AMP synthase n=1 Tax=Alkalispirochaeta americana TaxID=159291 RepID=A0A1N6NFR4_9SPIO|nr:L-threonylcarbamoyladenylate synthase [Alkalispirochaeta americana]SIP90891.1 L-threonylcarbamoyladenylate synthase [Alkalispirochaeta americana]
MNRQGERGNSCPRGTGLPDQEETLLLDASGADRAGQLLAEGRLVVIPTETVYGLGASAVDPGAVRAVFAAKERPLDNPLIVHFGDSSDAVAVVPSPLGLTRALLQAFAPGPLTVIVPAPSWAVPEVRCGLPTVALRVPAHTLARQVISRAGVPVAAPSANRSGRPSPTTREMAWEEMAGRVAALVDGGCCTVGIESTVVDATSDREVVILRPGTISRQEIARRLGCPVRLQARGDRRSPGTRYRHYTPRIPVVLAAAADLEQAREEAGELFPCDSSQGQEGVRVLSVETFGSYEAYAEGVYRAFWEAERRNCFLILAEDPPRGAAEGLADRLHRAARGVYRPGGLSGQIRENSNPEARP